MRFARVALAIAAILALLGAAGCEAGSAAGAGPDASNSDSTVAQPDAGTDADATADTGYDSGYAVCPEGGLDASYSAIYSLVLATDGCGAQNKVCHSTFGAQNTGSLLDYSLDASAVYTELLGDGGGALASDPCGDAGGVLLRVVPYDADASFLYIKLTLTHFDRRYGQGMPLYTPASVCPEALDAIKTWIDDGAQP